METKAAAAHEEVQRCPPAMRPDRVPIPPPWESVRFSFEKELIRLKKTEHQSEESRATTVNDNSLTNFDCGKCNIIDVRQCDF